MFYVEFLIKIVFLIILFIPSVSYAQINITEIMYNYNGVDKGYEWVEIYNSGSLSVNIDSWYFFENDIHHGLYPDGFISLDPGEYGLIVQDLANIYGLYDNTLLLIKSSFLLNNTGEAIALSNSDKIIQENVTYTSDIGGDGDGTSLQWNGLLWVYGNPTPGKLNKGTSLSTSSSKTKNTSRIQKSSPSKKEKPEYYTAIIKVPNQVLARSNTRIRSYVTHTKENTTGQKLKGGIYFLNFGDGSFIESDTRIDTEHIYEYPGEYELVFEFYPNRFKQKFGKNTNLKKKYTLTVHDQEKIEIINIDIRSSIEILNIGNIDIDMGGWSIVSDKGEYIFPKGSIIKPQKIFRLPKKVHRLQNIRYDTWIVLQNENTITVSSYTENKYKLNKARGIISKNNLESDIQDNFITKDKGNYLDYFLKQHPNKTSVSFGKETFLLEESKKEEYLLPLKVVVISGLVALILVSIRAYHSYKKKDSLQGVDDVIGDIELIE